jgi:hypothetical protein
MSLRHELDEAGYALRRRALDGDQRALLANLLPDTHAARNLLWERAELRATLSYLRLDELASEALGEPAMPINLLLLDKTAEANWKVPGHQDRVLPVDAQVDEPGFEGWTTKQGVVHVEPPVAVLEKMVALRIHLDDCPASNGALAVIPGSHRGGKLGDAALAELPHDGYVPCEAAAGDVLVMRPLLVHRSSPAEAPTRRRVVHVVYAADHPGEKVRWKSPAMPAAPAPEPPLELVPPEETRPRVKKPPHPLRRFLEVVVWLALAVAGVVGVFDLIHQVRLGKAGEIYTTMCGWRLSNAQALVFMAVGLLALVVGGAVGHWQDRHQRDFDRRYPPRSQ